MRRRDHAFTLVEVVIAIGVFSAGVLAVLGLLPGLIRQGAENREALAAQRLTDALTIELQRLATGGFDALAGEIPDLADPPPPGFAVVAERGAPRLHSRDYLPPAVDGIALAQQYFLLECWRATDVTLAYSPTNPLLALHVRVSWPYRTADGTAIPPDRRRALTFPVSLRP